VSTARATQPSKPSSLSATKKSRMCSSRKSRVRSSMRSSAAYALMMASAASTSRTCMGRIPTAVTSARGLLDRGARLGERGAHAIAPEQEAAHDEREGLDGRGHGRGVVERDALLLEVAVVRQGQSLEDREDRDEIADRAAGAPAHELGDIRILLLGHDARPG